MSSVTPFSPPLGPQPANPTFYSSSPTTLQMKENILSLTGDDFTITTAEGTPVCKCKGKYFSLHGTKEFTDVDGNDLFTVKKKLVSLYKTFECESPQGYNFEVKGHFSLGKSKSSIHFKNASDGQQVELDLEGDWFDRKASITLGGRPVADVQRKFFNARELVGDKQTVSAVVLLCFCGFRWKWRCRKRPYIVLTYFRLQYYVTVAPNVDLTMVAAICVCLDERENES